MTLAGYLLVGAIGFLFGAVLVEISHRRELVERDAWEAGARRVLRIVAKGNAHAVSYARAAEHLLSDERGA